MPRSATCSAACPRLSSRRASAGGQLRVDDEAHLRVPQDRVIVLARRKRQDRGDVLGLEIGIVGEDLVVCRTGSQEVEDVLDADAETTNTRAASAHRWIDSDAIECAHLGSSLCPAGHCSVREATIRTVRVSVPWSMIVCANSCEWSRRWRALQTAPAHHPSGGYAVKTTFSEIMTDEMGLPKREE